MIDKKELLNFCDQLMQDFKTPPRGRADEYEVWENMGAREAITIIRNYINNADEITGEELHKL